jgi:O-antigen/teichoic acid export membrane protein
VSSHREILRSNAIVGGSSLVSMLIGIVKVKALAVLLGPAGVGLMGIYQNVVSVGSTVASLGIAESGVRQLALAPADAAATRAVGRALWLSSLVLGMVGIAVMWILRADLSRLLFGGETHARAMAWLGIAVFVSLVSVSQTCVLQGLRRIGDLARVRIASAVFGAIAGVLLIWVWRDDGVLWFVIAAPVAAVVVAQYYVGRAAGPRARVEWRVVLRLVPTLLKLGIPLMGVGLLTLSAQLAARAIVMRSLGVDAAGYFQASWAISMTYIGLLLGAMGQDYYPRLSGFAADRAQMRKLVDEQTEMALLLGGPILLAVVCFAPLVVHVLYSSRFGPAAEVLRWQALGDIVKLACWPMGFVLLALGRGGLFLATQAMWNAVYIVMLVSGLPSYGLVVAGASFWLSFVALQLLNSVAISKAIGYRLSRRNLVYEVLLSTTGIVVIALTAAAPALATIAGACGLIAAGAYSVRRLNQLVDLRSMIQNRLDAWALSLPGRK